MTRNTDIGGDVGRALRRLRTERDLTARQLADASDMSSAMISRIENGHVSPSLNTLQALADALSVSIMALFSHSESGADVHHVPAGAGLASRRILAGHTHDYLLLGKHSDPGGSFQSARITIRKEDAGILPRYQHEGYVFLYVVRGQAIYACGDQTFDIKTGDTLSLDAKLPHGFAQIVSEEFEFITVSSRPV